MVIDFEPEPILERVNYFRNSTESNETTLPAIAYPHEQRVGY